MADTKATTTVQNTGTAAASTAAPATVRKMVKRTVIFRAPYMKKDGTTTTICSADVLGCFGGLPVAIKDFALSVPRNGAITVYMPSGMYGSSRVGPVGGEMSDGDAAAFATRLGPEAGKAFIAEQKAGRAAMNAIGDALLNAWSSFGTADFPERFGKPVEIELPE